MPSQESRKPLLLVIAGPTATGKTDLAIRIARHYGAHILSFDSRQFYHEMQIGTAVPSSEQLAQAEHHFIRHISIHDKYNVSTYVDDALTLIQSQLSDQKVIVAVGGSGLYIQALLYGLDKLPDVDPALRLDLQERLAQHGLNPLVAELQALDPVSSQTIDLMNPRRVLRALEICLQTGKPYSSFLGEKKAERPFRSLSFVVSLPREELYQRIDQRVLEMMANGLEEEGRSLYAFRELNALNTVGYKELFAYFEGRDSLDAAIADIQKNTRRFAKRQTTWFGKYPTWERIGPEDDERIIRLADPKL